MNVLKLVKAIGAKPYRYAAAVCVVCLLFTAGVARAQTIFQVDGITYKTLTSSTVQVGDGERIHVSPPLKVVEIPSTVIHGEATYTVTGIGDWAFYGSAGLTSVTLSASVMTIGDYAFDSCSSLEAFVVSPENPAFCTVDGVLFTKDKTRLIAYPQRRQGAYTVPANVTSIEYSAFSCCFGLTSVMLPDSLTTIGAVAFNRCSNLTSVTLPTSLTSIGNGAFLGCYKLTGFDVPSDNPAFCAVDGVLFTKDKTRLIAYPENKPEIFYTIPDEMTSFEKAAFSRCFKLQIFYVSPKNKNFCTVDGVLFSKDKTRLIAYPKGKSEDSYTVPASVTTIGESAFSGCCSLSSVKLSASVVTSIEDDAFSGCLKLASVTMPKSLTSIGDFAFSGCRSLTSVTLPASLTNIGNYAFLSCEELTSISLSDSLIHIGDFAFAHCRKLASVTMPKSLTSIGNSAFYGCSKLTSVKLSDSLTSIGDKAFSGCYELASVTLPESVKNVGSSAFVVCNKLTSVSVLGTKEPTFDDTAFSYGPPKRILYVPNATGGFTAKKWGAASVVYGSPAGK